MLRGFGSLSVKSLYKNSTYDISKMTGSRITPVRSYSEASCLRTLHFIDKTAHKGATPSNLGSVDIQKQRALSRLRSFPDDLQRYEYLNNLRCTNSPLFYRLLVDHLIEMSPLVYTPVVGDACTQWSYIYNGHVDALYLNANDKGNLRQILAEYEHPIDDVAISVVTDSSRILGLGDLGVGGVGISIGKLSLYIAGAGIRPSQTLPIVLDLGTNNAKLLEDPLYLGIKQKRLSPSDTRAFVSEFMDAFHARFPKAIIQFEDFSNDTCFDILSDNRDLYPCFNDDIQGTSSVALAGFIRALQMTGKRIQDQRVVFFGAGSAAVGCAQMMVDHAVLEHGMTKEEAAKMFYLVDSKGLVADNRGDKLQAHKIALSRHEPDAPRLKTLEETIEFVKPTALLGLSTVGGAFTPAILRKMAELNELPIIFPLSNPTTKSECTFEAALEHTDGRVLFASGSPFLPVTYKGKQRFAQQGNNMYIFPGLGLGCVLAQVNTIPDPIIHAAASALATSLNEEELAAGSLYPELTRIREVSVEIARQVIRAAQKANVDSRKELRLLSDEELNTYIQKAMWDPEVALSKL